MKELRIYTEEELEIAVQEVTQEKDKEIKSLNQENGNLKKENNSLYKRLAYALEELLKFTKIM